MRSITGTNTLVAEATVRLAGPDDREALRGMYETFEPRPASLGLPPQAKIDEWLDRLAPAVNYLALVGEKLVGHAILCPENGTGEVAVFVHQDYRGQGIGRLLLSALVEEGQRLGLRRAWGMTELDNVPMLALAHAVGFVPDSDPGMFHMDLRTEPSVRKS
ncbi:MAG: GNAT family N-acetyltransferase [Acidobacteriota bacterium]|nr:GNAT family N-acetyltransferase [Acidobacteriota bacterium]